MRWWGQNWGNVIAIAALTLAVPLSIAGNLVTPLLKNWWAERSVSTARKRLVRLKKELEKLEKKEAISEGEEIILRFLLWGDWVFSVVTANALGAVTGWFESVSEHLQWGPMPFSMLTIHIAVLILLGTVLFGIPLQYLLVKRSPSIREKYRRDIEKLERKVASLPDKLSKNRLS